MIARGAEPKLAFSTQSIVDNEALAHYKSALAAGQGWPTLGSGLLALQGRSSMQIPPLVMTFLANARLFLLVGIVLYAYFAFMLMVIATKTSTANAWLAWVPIGNLYLMCRIAR